MKNGKIKYTGRRKCLRNGCPVIVTDKRKTYPFCDINCKLKHETPLPALSICVGCSKEFKCYRPTAKFCSDQCKSKYHGDIVNKMNGRVSGMATSTIGAMSELMACVDLIRKGYEVYRAMSPSSYCDILGIKDGVVHLYEVRTGFYGTPENGNKLRWPNNRTAGKEILVVTQKDGVVHHIPKN